VFHFAIIAVKLLAKLDEPNPRPRWLYDFLLELLAPFVLLVPLIILFLGELSDSGWIRWPAKICTVLAIVSIFLLLARRMERLDS
jgi:hypothetical protein